MANPNQSAPSSASNQDNKKRKTHGRTTLADVAMQAGVTTMTVSRVLREPGRVASTTAERVRAAVAATGYVPNKSAGLLASGRSRTVAALVPNIANSIFAETIQGLSDALQADGFELLLAATGYNLQREEDQIRAVLGWAPSALVVTGHRHTPAALALMQTASLGGVPVIEMWDHSPRKSEFVQVGFSHLAAGQAMLAHLIECGYQDLVYAESGVAGDVRAHERRDGFLKAARKHKAHVRVVIAPQEEPMAAGRKVLLSLIKAGPMPQAIALSNDFFAAGVCLQAQDNGIAIATQLGVMGFGDMPIASQVAGGISTLAVARYGIGLRTGQHVLAALSQSQSSQADKAVESHVLVPQLLHRNTTQKRK